MAGELIAPLRLEDLDLSRTDFGFVKLAADSLGNAATDQDGTKELLEEAARGFTEGAALVASLDPELTTHFAPLVEATHEQLAVESQQLAADLDKGDKLLKEAGVEVQTETPPDAPKVTTLNTSGGGM